MPAPAGGRRLRQSRSRKTDSTGSNEATSSQESGSSDRGRGRGRGRGGRGSNRTSRGAASSVTDPVPSQDLTPTPKEIEEDTGIKKFAAHRKEAQESIQKLLGTLTDSSSDEEDERDPGDDADMETEKIARGVPCTCVVCLEKVRSKDSIWQCDQCFCLLHLPCTQQWARSCYSEDSGEGTEKIYWACPKCRMLYPRDDIPRQYRCFCGKVENPPPDPWIYPHSVGIRGAMVMH